MRVFPEGVLSEQGVAGEKCIREKAGGKAE